MIRYILSSSNYLIITLLISWILLLQLTTGSFVGIDLGSEYIKVSGVLGKSIDIILNEQSRRKTPNYFGFRNSQIYAGEDALSLAARFPHYMLPAINKLLGVSDNDSKSFIINELLYPYQYANMDDNTNVITNYQSNPDSPFSSEELVGLLLSHIIDNTEREMEVKATKAIISVPYNVPSEYRLGLLHAGKLAGIDIIGLVSNSLAAALRLGIQRRGFGNSTVNIAIMDVGSTFTEVGVFTFSPTKLGAHSKRIPLVHSLGTLETRAIISDPKVGGRHFDICIAEAIEKKIMNQYGTPKILVFSSVEETRAAFSLLRAAQKIRETLSANNVAHHAIEGVINGADFMAVYSREEFESDCDHLFQKALKLVTEVISKSGISLKSLTSFEVIGGAVRSPKFGVILSKYLGRTVDRTLNGDEAVTIGTSFYGINLIKGLSAKSFKVISPFPYDYSITVHPQLTDRPSTMRPVFVSAITGQRISLTFKRTKDFSIYFFETYTNGTTVPVYRLDILNVEKKIKSAFKELGIMVQSDLFVIRVELRASEKGLITVEEVELIVKSEKPETKEKEKEITLEEELEEMRKGFKSIVLEHQLAFLKGNALSKEDFRFSVDKLLAIKGREKARLALSEAKNHLESFIQIMKYDGLLYNEYVEQHNLISESERIEIEKRLFDEQQWVEETEISSNSSKIELYISRLNDLKEFLKVPISKIEKYTSEAAARYEQLVKEREMQKKNSSSKTNETNPTLVGSEEKAKDDLSKDDEL